jgi:hypothetical protein
MVIPKCHRLVMIENSIVSLPKRFVAEDVNAAPTSPTRALRVQRPPA